MTGPSDEFRIGAGTPALVQAQEVINDLKVVLVGFVRGAHDQGMPIRSEILALVEAIERDEPAEKKIALLKAAVESTLFVGNVRREHGAEKTADAFRMSSGVD